MIVVRLDTLLVDPSQKLPAINADVVVSTIMKWTLLKALRLLKLHFPQLATILGLNVFGR